MTNITLIFLLMQVVDNQIHNSRFGLISAFIWGVIYSANTPYTLDFVIHRRRCFVLYRWCDLEVPLGDRSKEDY